MLGGAGIEFYPMDRQGNASGARQTSACNARIRLIATSTCVTSANATHQNAISLTVSQSAMQASISSEASQALSRHTVVAGKKQGSFI